jgi:hypothetical protein
MLITSFATPAYADAIDAQALSGAVVQSANDSLKSAFAARKQVAQAMPVGDQHAPVSNPGLPTGFTYTLDASIAYPFGSVTQGNQEARLPGGFDAVAGYGFNSHFRAQAGYYVLQEYPVGFSTGTVPLYLQGLAAPIGSASLQGLDATIRNQIFVGTFQGLTRIGKLPIVISPTYVARKGTIGGNSDFTPIEINGFAQNAHLRTFQYQLVGVTIPFLSTSKMFGTYTIAPQWLVQPSGANASNHAQLFQLLYLEYRANDKTTFYLQPSLLPNYTPSDVYPEHIPTLIYGFTHKFDKLFYIQGQVSSGTPTNPNNGGIGITALTCQKLPCAPNQVVPTIGGLKASQVQLMLGIGKPQVLPL